MKVEDDFSKPSRCLITNALAVPVTGSCFITCQSACHKVKRLMLVGSSWTGARLPVATSGDLDQPEVDMKWLHDYSRTTSELHTIFSAHSRKILPVKHKKNIFIYWGIKVSYFPYSKCCPKYFWTLKLTKPKHNCVKSNLRQ